MELQGGEKQEGGGWGLVSLTLLEALSAGRIAVPGHKSGPWRRCRPDAGKMRHLA